MSWSSRPWPVVTVLLASLYAAAQLGPHNLSISGPGPVKATSETDACKFCHVPHTGTEDPSIATSKPLWNHQLSVATYTLYTSTTYKQTNAQPSYSATKQCLSCHDGTIALGQTVANGLMSTTGSLPSSDNLGTDLSNDHPFGFNSPFTDDGELKSSLFSSPPSTGDPAVLLYNNKLECVTCHNVHVYNLDAVVQKFLVRSNANSAMCLACHDPSRPVPNYLNGWSSSAHSTFANSTGGNTSVGGYSSVQADACMSCHVPHNANPGARLTRASEYNMCSSCHDGGVSIPLSPALGDVMSEFTSSTYAHPITLTGVHDVIAPAGGTEAVLINSPTARHSQCPDCHNPHAAQQVTGISLPPTRQVSLAGAAGISAADGTTVVNPAANQYEICFRCHGNSNNKPQSASYATYGRTPDRQTHTRPYTGDPTVVDPYNERLRFASSSAGYAHDVTSPRSSHRVPDLRTNILQLDGSSGRSLGTGTSLYCTDCHNNDSPKDDVGSKPAGPHGSNTNHILERRYDLEGVGGSAVCDASGACAGMCNKCHDVVTLISGNAGTDPVFRKHWRHVNFVGASCSDCHDPHGIQGGNSIIGNANGNNVNLVNFDTNVVSATSKGKLYFEATSTGGSCSLVCHNRSHSGASYTCSPSPCQR